MAIEFHRDGPWDLPEGWVWARLGSLTTQRGEKLLPDRSCEFEFVGMDSVQAGSLRIDGTVPFRNMKSAGNKFYPGDLLYGRLRPYLNKVVVADFEGVASGEFIILHDHQGISPQFLQYWMHSRRFVNEATRDTSGDRPRITFEKIAEVDVPIPPFAEQERIVARIDELFTDIADGEAELTRARTNLDTWRRALLKAAVTGELTQEWRDPAKRQFDAKDILADIALYRKKSGYRLKSSKSRERELDVSAFEGIQLPEYWTFSTVGDLIADGPQNGYSPKRSSDGTGTRALKLTATTEGRLRLDDRAVKYLSETIPDESPLYLEPGDLLFQRGNTREYVGISAVYSGPLSTYIFPDLMIRVRAHDRVLANWISTVANSPYGRTYMQDNASGTAGTMPKITGEIVKGLPIPLPPYEEIVEILRAVTSVEDEFGGEVEHSGIDASAMNALRQSILKSAFEGKLVEQDSRDEPADVMLARLTPSEDSPKSRKAKARR